MVQWLKALADCPQDLGSISSTHMMGLQPSVISVLGQCPCLASLGNMYTHGTHIYMPAKYPYT